MAALDDGPVELRALAKRVDADRRAVARHARSLEQAGLVRRERFGRGTTYRLTNLLSFSDEEYASISPASREAAVAATLAQCHTAAVAALEGQGFERPDIHLSRTSLELTEAQWQALSADFAKLLDRIDAAKAQEKDAGDATVEATTVLMLFERSGNGGEHVVYEDEPFSMAEGLERSWDLSEELECALSAPSTDWAAVIALGDQLRVLGRAALNAELSESARRNAADASTSVA
jgi:DNA-binding MarR family transcriptional regulator